MQIFRKIIFILVIVHFSIVFIGLLLLPFLPIAFFTNGAADLFYFNICLKGTPIAILISLFWSIRLEFSFLFNFIVLVLTLIISIGSFYLIAIILSLLHYVVFWD